MTTSSLINRLAATVLLMSVSGQAVAAVDAAKFTELLKAKLALNNMVLEVAGSELSGPNVILKDAKITSIGATAPLEVGDVTFENVSEQGEGYLVQRLAVKPYEMPDAAFTTNFKGATFNNILLLPGKPGDPMSPFTMYESAELAGMEIVEDGTRVFSIGSGKATMSPYKPNEKISFDMVLNDIYGNFTSAKSPEVKKTMGDMGYSEISGKITMKGSWDPKDGRMIVPEFATDFDKVGRLNFAFDISGYTALFAKQLQDLAKASADQPDGAQGVAMMGLFCQLNFHSLTIRFDDASLTNKLIDYAAKQSNQPREAIVAQAKGAAPMALATLQDAALIQKVSEAVSAYLDGPKSFEIKAAPQAPLSFAVLAATGMSAPAQLAQQIGLTVTANQ